MNKLDYNKQMKEIICGLTTKPTLLLHSCCAPCSSSVLKRLVDYFDITIFFYNPNMDSLEEFEKRKSEEKRLVNELNLKFNYNIKMVDCDYSKKDYDELVVGLENEHEGGKRCDVCYRLRLTKTCQYAKNNNFNFFTTTLSVSPYKNAKKLNDIGLELENAFNVRYLVADFKKEDGYKQSILLSKEYNLYRQNYCGCQFSKNISLQKDNKLLTD